ncbi:hypothetical protein BSKO_13107 [Bryopsis sp. KO-2023]|nr:hypothetical protein BSKO_13107 [Bryopsis sp. KO-2023]
MYKRDLSVLVLSAFAVYFALQNEGTFSFRKAWYFPLTQSQDLLYDGAVTLPSPVVIDMNGDGDLEVIVATPDFKVQVLKPRAAGKEGDGFAMAHVMAEVSLLPGDMHLTAGRHPVALAAGFLDPPPIELVRRPRKAVLVVVTSDWLVTCFDHNLKPLWEKYIHDDIPQHAVIEEIAISISNHTMYGGDRGLIVIGGSMRFGATLEEEEALGAAKGIQEEDPFEAELQREEQEQQHARSHDGTREVDDVVNTNGQGVDTSVHFSYYAYEGGKGHVRWNHQGSDFHRNMDVLKDNLIPQVNYRLDAESLEARHYGEVSCREYRESVLHSLPHQWTNREDTKLVLSHFAKHKPGKGSKKKSLGEKKTAASGKKPQSKDAVSKAINRVAEKATESGRSSGGLPKDPVAALPPNAIVAHLKEGIEAIHLYSGRTLCKLHLPEGGLHADLNGDGVLDHIQASETDRVEFHSDTGHRHIPGCSAYATSGIPPTEPLFNGSICRNSFFDNMADNDERFNERPGRKVKVAPPVMLPVPTPSGHYRFRYGQRGYAVFFNSHGLVTAFGAHGDKKWQISTPARWPGLGFRTTDFVPTLKALALRVHSLPTVILAAGLRSAAIISEHGHVLLKLKLPESPVAAIDVVDFNGDALNDLILVGKHNVYGYAQIQHPGGVPFSMLLLCLIVAMGVIYTSQVGAPSKRSGRPVKRSTDRVD